MTVPRPDVTRDTSPGASSPQLIAAAAAAGAGLSGNALVTAVAIAGAESQYNAAAHCLNCVPGVKEDSRGLWQINVDAHPQYAGENLYDPATNAHAMVAVSGGGKSFHPWSTFTSGAYLNYLPIARGAVALLGDAGANTSTVPLSVHQVFPDITDAQWRGFTNAKRLQLIQQAAQYTAAQAGIANDKAHGGVYGAVNGIAGGIAHATLGVGEFLSLLANPATWRRVAFVVLGLVGLVAAAFLLDKSLMNQVAGTAVTNAAGAIAGRL